jgi:hypothetical protein
VELLLGRSDEGKVVAINVLNRAGEWEKAMKEQSPRE